jgi:hypothetical protein
MDPHLSKLSEAQHEFSLGKCAIPLQAIQAVAQQGQNLDLHASCLHLGTCAVHTYLESEWVAGGSDQAIPEGERVCNAGAQRVQC